MASKIVKKAKTSIEINNIPLMVTIYEERRRNARISLTKNGAILRMPYGLSKVKQEECWEWFKDWISEQLTDKKRQEEILGKTYEDGSEISIFNRNYIVKFNFEDRKTHAAKLQEDNILLLKLSQNDNKAHLNKSIRQLISRVIAKDCLVEFSKKVDNWNDAFFKEEIKDIRLKNNQSNWGSCSTKRNLNFSTRLLFAPEDVIDYVIVHELAHLKEMNHSPKFWKIVSDIMPDYEEKEVWLKENGRLCNF
jgi:predicted metal-dependent hydrolase